MEMMDAHYKNRWKATHGKYQKEKKFALKRMERWEKSYGQVGCFKDLVKIVAMYDRILTALDECKP